MFRFKESVFPAGNQTTHTFTAEALYEAITTSDANVVVCHEGDPEWTRAIMRQVPSLVSLRLHATEDSRRSEHNLLSLTLRHSKFRMLKLNREGVRSLWSAQQQELIFFGNENEERGSIQQMRSAARNLITQACDLPVGYPIYISGLCTSYATPPPDVGGALSRAVSAVRNLLPVKSG